MTALYSCSSKKDGITPTPNNNKPKDPLLQSASVNDISLNSILFNISLQPKIRLAFSQPLKQSSVSESVKLKDNKGVIIPISASLSNGDSVMNIQITSSLHHITKYSFTISNSLQSASGGALPSPFEGGFVTRLDSTPKFPLVNDNALLDEVQKRTLKYFWDFAHPVSGLAREGSKHDPKIVTSGGSGFGIMALIVAAERGFIPKLEVLNRMKTIVGFLKNNAQTFHGAFPHWLDGSTGIVIPFSTNDNGADQVETSFLVQGLLCARQYFNGTGLIENLLRADINTIIDKVEWNWFRQNNQEVLYWHWSPDKGWAMNMKIQGWNESLITYVLAASSKNYSIPKSVYDNGWARNGAMKNGNNYGGISLPLGSDWGGPLFFEHYSFLGINPRGLSDAYANYEQQTVNHTQVNYNYCKTNPRNYYGYSDLVWGLTASNIKGGYTASSPTNDQGFIAPTAALSSMPYTPNESLAALKFFYFVLGDKIFKEYGFVDALSLNEVKNGEPWYSDAFLAIDQGPIIVMIENYRSQMLWNLFTSCPEVKDGMKKLGFSAPYL
ncbi:MAG TPA: glucoamylase family protein [Niabella sp.]|nr:glucoamylase family protein [Niabella sp.]HQX41138.1 glucoamylase family protein [Niabella sp.]HRB27822.1 glucoamylase family protein [Niabella sp.]HRB47809.1 glucoamylase family protein [Niabella sp.]HRB63122.1 glucoamylase family protein [Niabella sp.]